MTKTRHNTNFLSDNCLSATFRWFLPLCLPQRVQVISTPYTRIGNISTSPCLVSLSSGIDKQTIPPDQNSHFLHGRLLHHALALGMTRGPQDRTDFPRRPTRIRLRLTKLEKRRTHIVDCRLGRRPTDWLKTKPT